MNSRRYEVWRTNQIRDSWKKYFTCRKNHTDVKTEVIAGITTFMTMAYILAVNPEHPERHGNGQRCCLYSHCPRSLVATLLMAAFANYPFAGARHGTECLLCIHRSTPDGLYLADGSGSRICGRPYLHRTVSYQCA